MSFLLKSTNLTLLYSSMDRWYWIVFWEYNYIIYIIYTYNCFIKLNRIQVDLSKKHEADTADSHETWDDKISDELLNISCTETPHSFSGIAAPKCKQLSIIVF